MCMKLRFRDFFPKTTEEPITVYKVLRVENDAYSKKIEMSSPHIGTIYRLGQLMKAKMSKSLRSVFPVSFNVNHGLHTFVNLRDAIDQSVICFRDNYWQDQWSGENSVSYKVFECEIPAGSQYYRGVWASRLPKLVPNIVSNQLLVIKKVY